MFAKQKYRNESINIFKCHKSPFVQMTDLFALGEKSFRKEIILECSLEG